ncbi:MAG: ParB N-terminal domain-containing protein [Pirellulales bacterium]|nr:ParB N-terminal domain-containing protein [Pirellulales bacterium]
MVALRGQEDPSKDGHVRIREFSITEIKPSPENDFIYRPVSESDPEIIALAKSIETHGIREPLVITSDQYILSGHRRHAAAKVAGLSVAPCRIENISREANPDIHLALLREYNRQREKTLTEKLREELVTANPEDAYVSLIAHRESAAQVSAEKLNLRGRKRRSQISAAKLPFSRAVQRVLKDQRSYWPISLRRLHYSLLNDPPLKHASKPDSRYDNTQRSYKALSDLLTRMRLEGRIAMECISDETRPVRTWKVYQDSQTFIREQVDQFLKGYWRDLLQSQPNHIEIVYEKNTLDATIKPVAMEFCIPMTSGRGYASLPPRAQMAQRYEESGKDKLIVLILSDHDPDGEEIAHSFARSMRDDFGIDDIHPIKVALTADQAVKFDLPPILTAKKTSTNYRKFVAAHGSTVHELEALEPARLQQILRETIDGVLDREAFNKELDLEKQDAAFLESVRRTTYVALKELHLS